MMKKMRRINKRKQTIHISNLIKQLCHSIIRAKMSILTTTEQFFF